MGIVKSLTTTLRRIASLSPSRWPDKWFASLVPVAGESEVEYATRAREIIGARWGYTGRTLRQFEAVARVKPTAEPSKNERWPKDAPQFLRDLARYGGVQFEGENGAESIVPGTLDTGMDPISYIEIAPRTGGGAAASTRAVRAAQVRPARRRSARV